MVDSLYKQNLSKWIYDEKKVITYHYLSITLGVHVNLAKQMLYQFYQEELAKHGVKLEATFYVSGLQQEAAEDGDPPVYIVVLCSADKLDALRSQLREVYSVHIYSVKDTGSGETVEEAVSETLRLSNDRGQAGPEYGPFKIIKPQKLNQRVQTAMTNPIAENGPVKVEPVEDEKMMGGAHLDQKPVPDTSPEHKTTGTKNAKEVKGRRGVADSGAKDRLKNMFAAAAAKPRPIKKEPPPSTSGPTNTSRRPITSPARPSKPNVNGSKQKTSAKQKARPERQRSRILVFSSSSEDDRSKNDSNSGPGSDAEWPTPKRRHLPLKSDPESDDGLKELHRPREKPKATEKSCKAGRRRVARTVTKREVDEEGYTVVKREQVVVSESDVESELVEIKNDVRSTEEKEQKGGAPSTVTSKPGDSNAKVEATPAISKPNGGQQNAKGRSQTKQASITSFFQKRA